MEVREVRYDWNEQDQTTCPFRLLERHPGISKTAKTIAEVDVTKELAPNFLPIVHCNMGGLCRLRREGAGFRKEPGA